MESPKGFASVFMIMCPSMGIVEDLAGTLARAFSSFALAIWQLSWMIVLALLFLTRRLVFVDGRPEVAAAVATAGFMVLLAAEQVAFAKATRMALLSKSSLDANLKLSTKSSPDIGFAHFTITSHPTFPLRDGVATAKRYPATHQSSASGTKGKHDLSDLATNKAVRQAIIQIESELYGNEVIKWAIAQLYFLPDMTGRCMF